MTLFISSFRLHLLSLMFIAAFLWDFRPMGQRLFDLIPLVICAIYFLTHWKSLPAFTVKEKIFSTYFLLYCLYGYLSYQHKSSIIISVMFTLYIFLRHQMPIRIVDKILKYIYIVNLIIFFVQFGIYHSTHYLIDFQVLFGDISRVYYNGIFRPVGLYSEPHSFCISTVMLTLMTLRQEKMWKWHYLGCLALLLSLSLWGMIVVFVLVFTVASSHSQNLKEILKKYFLILTIILFGWAMLYGFIIPNQNTFRIISERLTMFSSDASLKERFAAHQPVKAPVRVEKNKEAKPKIINGSSQKSYTSTIFGHGISTYVFVQGTAINSFAFIYRTMGGLGIITFIFFLYNVWSSLTSLHLYKRLSLFIMIILLMTSYPMLSYAFFWLFLCILIQNGNAPEN